MTEPRRFRKKPVEIVAVPFEGGAAAAAPIIDWVLAHGGTARYHGRVLGMDEHIAIDTLEGVMRASIWDWIIRGVGGEFYPCKPDIFQATYEEIDS